MRSIEVFLQGHGISDIAVVTAETGDTIIEILAKIGHPGCSDDKLLFFVEDFPAPIGADVIVEELLPFSNDEDELPPLRLHVSHHHKVAVTVRFNGEPKERHFRPGTTVERVRRWSCRAFGLTARDAAEHVLQIQGTTTRPDRDTHIGTLTKGDHCAVAFDLVPCKRVEG
jgi:hypothetical protein